MVTITATSVHHRGSAVPIIIAFNLCLVDKRASVIIGSVDTQQPSNLTLNYVCVSITYYVCIVSVCVPIFVCVYVRL